MDQIEFIQLCLKRVELEKEIKALDDKLEAYALQHGEQTVGPCTVKISTPSRKFDYQDTWRRLGPETEVNIEDFWVVPEPIINEPYYDYMKAVKAAKIKPNQYTVTNLDQLNNKTAKVVVKL